MHEQNKSEFKLQSLEGKIQDLESQLIQERKINQEKSRLTEQTLAESEELSTHLQHTTLALAQERQIAEQKAEKEKLSILFIPSQNHPSLLHQHQVHH